MREGPGRGAIFLIFLFDFVTQPPIVLSI
jgi:hypothetical protein